MSNSTKSKSDDPVLLHQLQGLKDAVHDICWDPKNKKIAAASNDTSVYLWDMGNQNIRAYKFCGHSDAVTGVTFTPSGNLIASCSRDKMVRLWENSVEARSIEFKGHTAAVRSVHFSPNDNGAHILTASDDKSVKLWTVVRGGSQSHRFVRSFTGHTNWVRCARFSDDGDMIATSSDDGTIRLWDPDTGKEIHVFNEPKGFACHLDWHPSGRCIGVATTDNKVKVYDIRMLKLQQLYKAHQGPVSQVSFHTNGNYISSGSQDGSLKIFDLLEARAIYDLLGHKGSVTAVRFSPKGDYIASGESEKSVYVWQTNFDIVDKELGIVPPSVDKQCKEVVNNGTSKTKSVLKDQGTLQNQLGSLALNRNGNKENTPSKERSSGPKAHNVKNSNEGMHDESNSNERLERVVTDELGKINGKIDTIMQTLILLEKRISLVEDQVKLCLPQQSSP